MHTGTTQYAYTPHITLTTKIPCFSHVLDEFFRPCKDNQTGTIHVSCVCLVYGLFTHYKSVFLKKFYLHHKNIHPMCIKIYTIHKYIYNTYQFKTIFSHSFSCKKPPIFFVYRWLITCTNHNTYVMCIKHKQNKTNNFFFQKILYIQYYPIILNKQNKSKKNFFSVLIILSHHHS